MHAYLYLAAWPPVVTWGDMGQEPGEAMSAGEAPVMPGPEAEGGVANWWLEAGDWAV